MIKDNTVDVIKVVEDTEKYYNDLINEIVNNKDFEKAICNPSRENNFLHFSAYSRHNLLITSYYGDQIDSRVKVKIDGSVRSIENNFVKKILQKNIFIQNALMLDDTSYLSYVGRQYKDFNDIKSDVEIIKNIIDTTKSEELKTISKMVMGIFFMGFFIRAAEKSRGVDYFFNNDTQELYSLLNEYIPYIKLEKNIVYLKSQKFSPEDEEIIENSLNKLLITNLSINDDKFNTVVSLLKDLNNTKELIEKNYSEKVSKNFLSYIKDRGLTRLNQRTNNKKNKEQTEISDILMPLLNKENLRGLSLLKSEFVRNIEQENILEKNISSNEITELNFIVEKKKASRNILRFFDHYIPFESENITLKLGVIDSKNYMIKIIFKELIKDFKKEEIIDLKNNIKDIFLNEIEKICLLDNGSEKEIENFYNLNDLVLKEVRAFKLHNQLDDRNIVKQNKNKI